MSKVNFGKVPERSQYQYIHCKRSGNFFRDICQLWRVQATSVPVYAVSRDGEIFQEFLSHLAVIYTFLIPNCPKKTSLRVARGLIKIFSINRFYELDSKVRHIIISFYNDNWYNYRHYNYLK